MSVVHEKLPFSSWHSFQLYRVLGIPHFAVYSDFLTKRRRCGSVSGCWGCTFSLVWSRPSPLIVSRSNWASCVVFRQRVSITPGGPTRYSRRR